MKFDNVLCGADPELFLTDDNGKYISAIGKIGGSKMFPRKIDDYGSAVQEDNVAVEFNIPPAESVKEFITNLYRPLSYLNKHAASMNLKLSIVPSAKFDWDQLDNPTAMMFGCSVDFNVWTGKPNPRPEAKGDNRNLRTCGGHLHLSWDEPNLEERRELVRTMDLFLGVPSVLIDNDSMRRVLYGRAGAYRPKPYGVEYRVLSNFWIKNLDRMRWAFEQSHRAIQFLRQGHKIGGEIKTTILSAINNNNIDAAKALVIQFDLTVVE